MDTADREKLQLPEAKEVSEGLSEVVEVKVIRVTGLPKLSPELVAELPAVVGGLECVVLLDERPAAVGRLRDHPPWRAGARPPAASIRPRH